MDEEEKLPSFPLLRINQWRQKLMLDFYNKKLLDSILNEETFDYVVAVIARLFKIENAFVIRQLLLQFVEQELTARTVDLIGIKLAGNIDQLRKGIAIEGYINKPAWLPVEISELRYGRVRSDRTHVNMTATVMAGALAGVEIHKEFSYKMAVWPLANALAWTLKAARPVHSELVRMWFLGLLIPGAKNVEIDQFKCLANQRKWNQTLKKLRSDPCVRHYNQRCHTCPLGYLDSCYRSTHRYRLTIKACRLCKRENATFDPECLGVTVCISCQTKEARAHWARERRA